MYCQTYYKQRDVLNCRKSLGRAAVSSVKRESLPLPGKLMHETTVYTLVNRHITHQKQQIS